MHTKRFLPVWAHQPVYATANPSEAPVNHDSTTPAKPILVVEDDAAIREALVLLLQREKYTVLEAANGQEALDRLQYGPCPGLVLLDLMLPQVDGWAVLEAKRHNAPTAAVPVLVLTALGEPAPEEALSLGAVGYLRKPISIEDLLAEVRRWCT